MKLGDYIHFDGNGSSFPVYPEMLNHFGINETLFLCRISWWQRSVDAWVEKTADEVKAETGLSYKQQTIVRARLCSLGVLEQQHDRLNHIMRFRIVSASLQTELTAWDAEVEEAPAQRSVRETTVNSHLPKGEEAPAQRSVRELPKGQFDIIGKDVVKIMKDIPAGAVLPELILTNEEQPKQLSEHAKFVRGWCDDFEGSYHPDLQDMKQLKNLLDREKIPANELLGMTRRAQVMPDEWLRIKAMTIAGFCTNFNKIKAALTAKAGPDLKYLAKLQLAIDEKYALLQEDGRTFEQTAAITRELRKLEKERDTLRANK